jgi:hypothetical protein
MRVLSVGLVAAVAVAGCGDSTRDRPDVQAYAGLARQISGAAAAYGTADDAASDVPSCQSAHAAYDANVRPMVDRMRAMSGDMDREMEMMGHGDEADMTCGADGMMAELDRHRTAACTSADMAANHAEADRHATAMGQWAEHQRMRSEEMGGMMGMGGMGGSGPATCHRSDDGTYTLGP